MARFFVNRGGGRVPEGPFEEQQIIRLILAGKISSGHACEEGLLRFTRLESHPPFARALAEAGVVIAVPPPTAAEQRKAAGPKTSSSRGTLLGALMAFFGLALGAVALGAYIMFNTGGTLVHAAVPSDTELLFEVASVQRFVEDLSSVRVIDADALAARRLLSDAASAISASFGVSSSQANALILAASSLGVGARKLATAPEAGVLLTFNSATPVNTFLQSKRFTYTGLVSKNGRKYRLAAAPAEPGANDDATRRTLLGLKVDPQQTALVWFETSKVLFAGSPSFAEDVARSLSLDAPSLNRNPKFLAVQREFADKTADAVVYLDPAQLPPESDARLKSLLDGYVGKAEPAIASLRLGPAGLIAHIVARFTPPVVAGAPPLTVLPAAEPLTVIDRLPNETFAYVASVTKNGLSGSELRKLLLEQLAKSDPDTARQVSTGLTQLEQQLQTHFDDVLGSVGDQGAVALLAPADYSLVLAQPHKIAADFAVVYLQALKDEAPARALLDQLKQHFGALVDKAQIHEDPDGYAVVPNDDSLGVSLQLHFVKGYLCLAVGHTPLVARSLRALSSGEGMLSADPAHQAARKALPSGAQVFAWIDAGRIVSTVLKNPLLAPRAHDFGLDRAGIHWTGVDRVTAALAASVESKKGVSTYRVDTLNMPILAGVFGAPGL
jgi:hypothetical protein